jgi:hypothetical protein
MRKLGVTQRKLLWTIARQPGWTLSRNGVGRDRTTVAAVLDTLLKRGLVEPSGKGWRVTPQGAKCLLDLWPASTNPSFGAALRNYLYVRASEPEPRPFPTGASPTGEDLDDLGKGCVAGDAELCA